jgi:hypothetical protein
MAKVYESFNGAGPTTAAPTAVTTGTVVKTMIQWSTSASSEARFVEWWWEGSASAAATPAVVELMFHSTGAATVTAYTAATALGSIVHQIPVTSGSYFQYPLGREPEMAVSTFARLRNTVTPAVNAICGAAWEE